MIEPLPCFSIAGIWCLAARKALVRLTLRVPAFERNARGRPLFAEYAGIVEADIKAAIALLGTLYQLFGEGLVAHVAGKREGVSSLAGDLSHKRNPAPFCAERRRLLWRPREQTASRTPAR